MSPRDASLRKKSRTSEAPPESRVAAEVLPGPPLAAQDFPHSRMLNDHWRGYFRGLPVGSRLLDIAPGIGTLALLAQEVSRSAERGFEIHGLDQASTLNAEPLALDGMRFHACRYDRRTPFANGYFDMITVQWARPEEGAAASGLAELRRILKPGGRLRAMYHALGGTAHEQCQARSRAVDTLLDEFQLLRRARQMFEVAFTQETALKRDVVRAAMLAMESQRSYTAAAEQVALWSRGTPNPKAALQVLQLIGDCWEHRQSLPLAEIMAQLDRVEADLRAVQLRMRAVCALAVDETRVHRIGRLFKAAGFSEVKVRPFRDPGEDGLLAWDLQAA